MSTIVTRAGKGSPLTHNEVDANFVNLNADKAEVGSTNTFTAAQTISNQLNLTNASNYNLYASGAGANYMAGSLGIGATALTGINLNNSKNITGATTAYSYYNGSTIQSDVTSTAYGYGTSLSTQASAFTLGVLAHFNSIQGTIGATSAITTQIGFYSQSSLSGATNNRAFQGSIAAATNAFNLYMVGTANNYLAGALGIGSTSLTERNLAIAKTITGATVAYNILQTSAIQSDVTVAAYLNHTNISTQAAAFTLGSLFHFSTSQSTIGAGSAVTSQYGFTANSNLIGATNNYGFLSQIPAATGRYNLYMQGTADNYLAGKLALGSLPFASTFFSMSGVHPSTGTVIYGAYSGVTAPSTATSEFSNFLSVAQTTAAAFTLSNIYHFNSSQGTFGATSAVTTQSGYGVQANLTGATNNYAFRGLISAATGRFNLYMDGTANNYLAGALGIGTTGLTDRNLGLSKNITGATTAFGVLQNGVVQSDVTVAAYGFRNAINTAAAAFTLTSYVHYQATSATIGAGSAVTNQFGFFVESGVIGATNNYAFYGNIPALAGRYNLYMAGTADNYLAGSLGIGAVTSAGQTLYLSKSITGNVNSTAVRQQGVVQSDVTASVFAFDNVLQTAAAAFTLTTYNHYVAQQATIGAGSAITSQQGFVVASSITGATNNYAFRGLIPAATGRFNLYVDGTANNYLAGSLGIGVLPAAGISLYINKTITGAVTSYGIANTGTVQSDVTSLAFGVYSGISTAASAFTLTTLRQFGANGATVGAGSAITNQAGFNASSTLSTGTNNYGFQGDIAAATGRFNLYMGGTAANYFGGDMQFNKTVTAGGTTGAQTISKNAGTVNFAAAATSLVVTNTLVTANSIIICTVGTNDTTMKSASAVAAAGSFTIFSNAAATAETRVNFIVIN